MIFAQHLHSLFENSFAFAKGIKQRVLPTTGNKRAREDVNEESEEPTDIRPATRLRFDSPAVEARRINTLPAQPAVAQPQGSQPHQLPQQRPAAHQARTPELQAALDRQLGRAPLTSRQISRLGTPQHHPLSRNTLFSPRSRPSQYFELEHQRAAGQKAGFAWKQLPGPPPATPLLDHRSPIRSLKLDGMHSPPPGLQQASPQDTTSSREAMPQSNGALPPPPGATPTGQHDISHSALAAPAPSSNAVGPSAREGALTLQALQGRTGLLAALSLHADEEGRRKAQQQLDSAKARISSMDRRRAELISRVDRAVGSGPPGSRATAEVGVQHGETSQKLLEEQQQRQQRTRPPAQAIPGRPSALQVRPSAAQPRAGHAEKARGTAPRMLVHRKQQPAQRSAKPQPVVDLLDSDDEQGEPAEKAEQAQQEEESEESEEEEEESDLDDALAELDIPAQDGVAGPVPLTKHQRAAAERVLRDGNETEVICRHKGTNIEMTRKLMACLKPPAWLNDEVMNLYVGLLQDRDTARRQAGHGPKCHFVNSFFVNRLYKDEGAYKYANVKRWTNAAKLKVAGQASASVLDCNRVIVPVHLPAHWTCAVIDLQRQQLCYYDSMGGREAQIMAALRRWVGDEWRDKRNKEVDTSSWPILYPSDVPRQANGFDCGVFALVIMDYTSRDAALSFSQKHMRQFRQKIASDIVGLQIA